MTSSRADAGRGSAVLVGAALALVAVHLAVRTSIAARSYFYWDDLILVGRSAQFPLFSREFLLYDHDGHFMPAAFFLTGVLTRVAPYQWVWPALLLVLGQALASLALLRTLRLTLGWRPALLLPLTLYLFIPLTLPAFAWWSAAINALPLQIALAWVSGDAILLYRTGKRRYAASGAVVFLLALLFFEKSVVVPFVALAFVVFSLRIRGTPTPLRRAVRRCRALWVPCAVILAVWLPVYLCTVRSPLTGSGRSSTAELVHHATSLATLPTLLGGPWRWDRWIPGPAWADPPTPLVVLAWIALVGVVGATLRTRRRTGSIWLATGAYFAASTAAMIVTRSDADSTAELAQTLRYFTDSATVFALAAALVLAAPRRTPARVPAGAVLAVAILFVVSSLWSTLRFVDVWHDNPTREYLANARSALAEAQDVPLLDQPVSIWVLQPVAFPDNLAGHVFAPLRDRPEFASSTPLLRTLDDEGRLVDAQVTWARTISEGTTPSCGTRVDAPSQLALDGPLAGWEWTVQLNYLAGSDGTIDVALESGDAVSVPVSQGLHSVFVRLVGHGSSVRISPRTPGLTMCFGSGQVGAVVPAVAQ